MGVLQSPLLRFVIAALLVIVLFVFFVNKRRARGVVSKTSSKKASGSKAKTSSKKSKRDLLVPQTWTENETHATVTEVYVEVGDTIEKGELLVGLETMKAAVDVESEFTGRILSLSVEVGDEISQGDAFGTIETRQHLTK